MGRPGRNECVRSPDGLRAATKVVEDYAKLREAGGPPSLSDASHFEGN